MSDDDADDTPAPKIETGRADLGPMVKNLGEQLYADREERRKREAHRGHEYSEAPYQLAATVREIPADPADPLRLPRYVVETLGDLPHGMGRCHGIGTTRDAAALAYRKAFSRLLLDRRVMGRPAAADAGRRAEVHIVPVLVGPDGRPV